MADENLVDFYSDLHKNKSYGNTSVKVLRFIRPEIKILAPKSVIDYGCGQSRLLDELDLGYQARFRRYDPAIPAYSEKPEGVFDLLLNIDVLEHIREPDLDPIIEEMRSFCRNAILIVDTAPAELLLPDGQNAHVTLKPKDWWAERLGRHFPKLVPIRATRRTRAAFRTWDRTLSQDIQFHGMRAVEQFHHFGGRLKRKLGK
jgi:hypothetical protein